MYYLIDGYNFLFRLESPEGKSLEKLRNFLIAFLNEELAQFKAEIAIVFDSAEQTREFSQSAQFPHLEVIYAPKGQTADTYIIELVETGKNPKIFTVVTSDNGLARQCRQMGTKTLSIDDFLVFMHKKNKIKSPVKPDHQESSKEIERLRKIFEKKLERN